MKYTNQSLGTGASADKILMTQPKMIVVTFQHIQHTDSQLLPLRVYDIRQSSS